MDKANDAPKFLPNPHHLAEIKRINERRGGGARVRWLGRDGESGDACEPHLPGIIFDHAGMAFSGGGIRSAAFCLGAVQALEARGKLPAIDYLSTVSGGGYIGCAIAASMGATGVFPFAARSDAGGADEASVNDLQDSAAVQHIRDYSNYLMPRGLSDLTLSIGIVLRGLVASASLVVGPMLLLAALAIAMHPSLEDLKTHDAFGIPTEAGSFGHFPLVALFLAGLIAFLFVWGLVRSRDEAHGQAPYEFASNWPGAARWLLGALVVIAFLEAQPPAVLSLSSAKDVAGDWLGSLAAQTIATVANHFKVLAPIAGVITLVSGWLSDIIKAKAADPTWQGLAVKIASLALLWIAAIIVPLLLWVSWLHLVLWAVDPSIGKSALYAILPSWITDGFGRASVWGVYAVAGAAISGLSLLMEPNANSLHRLYRDRLSDAFLFLAPAAQPPATRGPPNSVSSVRLRPKLGSSSKDDVAPLDSIKLSELRTDRAPYLLINTALNIQGSPYVNKRGRNADFFLFSRDYVGSHATGFAPTSEMEKAHPALDLGTAMAISGAAVSSNMGASSIRILAPTLALLNVRLGYWMPNPMAIENAIPPSPPSGAPNPAARQGGGQPRPSLGEPGAKRTPWRLRIPSSLYLFAEMFSLLDEKSDMVYLTDGGHIENLGLYELLKRRCRLIVVVDAEADPTLSFPSFVTLQRYARIDLGIRIDGVAWSAIRARSRDFDRKLAVANATGEDPGATAGCHAAAGRIDYPDAPPGILLYVKSSMTGDENDLILDYKCSNPSFPHETTGDQFFGEAQFEAYRALGFHILMRVLTGEDQVPGLIKSNPDGSPLSGQSEADAQEQRKKVIDEIFDNRAATAAILAG